MQELSASVLHKQMLLGYRSTNVLKQHQHLKLKPGSYVLVNGSRLEEYNLSFKTGVGQTSSVRDLLFVYLRLLRSAT